VRRAKSSITSVLAWRGRVICAHFCEGRGGASLYNWAERPNVQPICAAYTQDIQRLLPVAAQLVYAVRIEEESSIVRAEIEVLCDLELVYERVILI
jgi:hypothetical protein